MLSFSRNSWSNTFTYKYLLSEDYLSISYTFISIYMFLSDSIY